MDSRKKSEPKEERDAFCKAPLSWNCEFGLVIQLQSELDLPRIVRSIARRADLAEGRIVVVARSRYCNNSITAEIRRVKVVVLCDVQELRTDLNAATLV